MGRHPWLTVLVNDGRMMGVNAGLQDIFESHQLIIIRPNFPLDLPILILFTIQYSILYVYN